MAEKKLVARTKAGTSKVSAEDRRIAFVEAYLSNGRNATDAALQAGYSKGGAAKQGYRMSKDPAILSMIDQRRAEIADKNALSTDELMADIAALANQPSQEGRGSRLDDCLNALAGEMLGIP